MMANGDTEIQYEQEPKKRSGKWIVALIVVLLIVSLAGNVLLWLRYDERRAHAQEMDDIYSISYFHFNSITVDTFKQKVASGEDFIVMFTRPNCSDCQRMEAPFIKLTEEKGISDKIYQLNVVLLRRDSDAWTKFKETYEFGGTPTYARFAGGKNVSCIGWTEEQDIDINIVERWLGEQSDFFNK